MNRFYGQTLLRDQLQALGVDMSWALNEDVFTHDLQLGGLQQAFALLQKAKSDYALNLSLNPFFTQQLAVKEQIQYYQELLLQREQHQSIIEKKLLLAEKDYRRHEQLHVSGAIADQVLEEKEKL